MFTDLIDKINVVIDSFKIKFSLTYIPDIYNVFGGLTNILYYILIFSIIGFVLGIVGYFIYQNLNLNNKNDYEDLLNRVRSKKKIILIIFYVAFFGIVINLFLNYYWFNFTTNNNYFSQSYSVLLYPQDLDDEKKNILKNEANIQEGQFNVVKLNAKSPNQNYELYVKVNFPNIKLKGNNGKLFICSKNNNCDIFEYKLTKLDEGQVLNINNDTIPLSSKSLYIKSQDTEKIIKFLYDKSYIKDIFSEYYLKFNSSNGATYLFSPAFSYNWYLDKVINNTDYLENEKISNVNRFILPLYIQKIINYPSDIKKQIRTYDVENVDSIYQNVVYKNHSLINFIMDLKNASINSDLVDKLNLNLNQIDYFYHNFLQEDDDGVMFIFYIVWFIMNFIIAIMVIAIIILIYMFFIRLYKELYNTEYENVNIISALFKALHTNILLAYIGIFLTILIIGARIIDVATKEVLIKVKIYQYITLFFLLMLTFIAINFLIKKIKSDSK